MTINEIMKNNPGTEGKILLVSTMAKERKVFFTPWFYHVFKHKWYGVQRWYGNNNHSLDFAIREAEKDIWSIEKIIPILPKGHSVREFLEGCLWKMKYRIRMNNKFNA